MATPCARLWPRLPPFLLLLLGVSQTRGLPPLLVPSASPWGQPSGAPLSTVALGPQREPEPEPGPPLGLPPPLLPVSWERENSTRAPGSPGPADPPPSLGAATQRGALHRAPGGRSAITAAAKSHKSDESSEPPRGNFITSSFNHKNKNISTVVLKGLEKFQTFSNQATMDASGSTTLALKMSTSRESTTSYSKTKATLSPGYSSESSSASSFQKNSSAPESFHQVSNSSESEGRTATFATIADFLTRRKERTFRSLTSATPSMEATKGIASSTETSTPSTLMHSSTSLLETGGPTMLSQGRDHTRLPWPHFSRAPTSPSPSKKTSPSEIRTELRNSIISSTLASQIDRTFTQDVPRTRQSSTNRTWLVNGTESSTKYSGTASSSVSIHSSSSSGEAIRKRMQTRNPSDAEFTEPSTDGTLGHASSRTSALSLQRDSSTFEGSQQLPFSEADAENGNSRTQTEAGLNFETFTRDGKNTSHQSVTNKRVAVTENSTWYAEIVNPLVLTQLSDQWTGSHPEPHDTHLSEPSTESLSGSSSEMSSSSSQSHPSSTGSNHGPIGSTNIGKRISDYHTDSTYISSTFTKIKDRTLLSITNNSTSPDITKSSTAYNRTSSSSAIAHSSSSSSALTQGTNISSNEGEFVFPSTEPLVVSSSDLPAYTSTVSVPPNTLVFQTSESVSTDESSSSSSLPPLPSPSVSQLSQPISSTPWPTMASSPLLFSVAESSKPLTSSLSPLSTSLAESTPDPVLFLQSSLPHLSSTSVLPSGDPQTRESSVTSADTLIGVSTTVLHGSSSTDQQNPSVPYPEKTSVGSDLQPPSLPPTDSPEVLGNKSTSEVPLAPVPTEPFREPTLLATRTNAAQPSPAMTTTTHATTQPSTVPTPMSLLTTVKATTERTILPIGPRTIMPLRTTESPSTTRASRVETEATTKSVPTIGIATSVQERSSRMGGQKETTPAIHFPVVSSPSPLTAKPSPSTPLKSTTVVPPRPMMTSPPTTANRCAPNPCLHDGQCMVDSTGRGYRCICTPSWQGDDCSVGKR
uniref:EGF-like domain-containing protein n=1 Tax=Monodelphis domestica TaxID=13616 RepID=A0A5F8GES6_MONDO